MPYDYREAVRETVDAKLPRLWGLLRPELLDGNRADRERLSESLWDYLSLDPDVTQDFMSEEECEGCLSGNEGLISEMMVGRAYNDDRAAEDYLEDHPEVDRDLRLYVLSDAIRDAVADAAANGCLKGVELYDSRGGGDAERAPVTAGRAEQGLPGRCPPVPGLGR